jgi:DNA-directed RNA polymerase subunit RPC12/RpoP
MDGICPECEEPSVFHLHPARNGVVFGPLKAAIIRRRGSVDYLEYAQEPSSSKRVILIAEAWATTHGTLYTGAGTAWKCLKCGRQNEGSNSNSTIPPLRCPECHGDVIARFERDNSKVLTTGQISAARGSAIGVTVITRLARGEVLRQVQRGSENDTERYITWGDGWLSVVTSRSDRPLRRSTTTITKGEARSLRSALRSRLGKQFPDGINPVTGKGDPRAINPVTGEEIRGWFEGAVELDELRQRMPYKR